MAADGSLQICVAVRLDVAELGRRDREVIVLNRAVWSIRSAEAVFRMREPLLILADFHMYQKSYFLVAF